MHEHEHPGRVTVRREVRAQPVELLSRHAPFPVHLVGVEGDEVVAPDVERAVEILSPLHDQLHRRGVGLHLVVAGRVVERDFQARVNRAVIDGVLLFSAHFHDVAGLHDELGLRVERADLAVSLGVIPRIGARPLFGVEVGIGSVNKPEIRPRNWDNEKHGEGEE